MTDRETYGPSTYGDRIADVYDSDFGRNEEEVPATVDLLAELAAAAGPGPVLELGIGTGRIALPLRARGLDVHGIDASEAMVAKLRGKPGGTDVPVSVGDFADVGVDGSFSLVFVVWNTLFALLSQDAQVRCFANVATRLVRGGLFLIDAFVPDPALLTGGQRVTATRVEVDEVLLGATQTYLADQRVVSQHIALTEAGARLYPVQIRYAWPAELDLMARLAGLELAHRWGGWLKEPFGDTSRRHVSVWRKPAT